LLERGLRDLPRGEFRFEQLACLDEKLDRAFDLGTNHSRGIEFSGAEHFPQNGSQFEVIFPQCVGHGGDHVGWRFVLDEKAPQFVPDQFRAGRLLQDDFEDVVAREIAGAPHKAFPAWVVLLRHIAVDDCGTIVNPLLVKGQQHGGLAQGAAQVLYEHVQYDEDANPVTGNLMDYAMPSAAEFPSFEVYNTETPSPLNPLGAKGIGESGTIGSTPAIHNAVVDAVSYLGVTHIDMPCTAECVWSAIQAARSN
jgi:hypothetical protein